MRKKSILFNVCILALLFSFIWTTASFASQYKILPKQQTTDIYKKWTVTFNKPLDISTVTNENIFVQDSNGSTVKTKIILNDNLKSIEIEKVENPYKMDKEYFLYLKTNIKSNDGTSLSKPLRMPFTINSFKKNIQNYILYNVQAKDTLWRISRNFNIKIDEIKTLNNLSTDSIWQGQALKIPYYEPNNISAIKEDFKLGNERLLSEYSHLIDGKKIGLITNQTGVNSIGESTIDILANYDKTNLTALYGPEHGIDGKASAGDYVKSYTHKKLNIPVYSLYGDTRKPTKEMLANIDVLIFDIQDIGARSYTYKSTLNLCMKAASEYNKQIIVLDRPNPLGGIIMDGPILEDKFKSFVGIDNIPMTHGMTIGELAKFFNRKINAELTVVPMTGYHRYMIYQDTGLKWVQSSPYIPDITSVFCYSSTGLGENTTIFQSDYFKWVGSKNIDSSVFAKLLNDAKLPGVEFIPEDRGSAGGVRLNITDYHSFNPVKTGIHVLAYGRKLKDYKVPKSTDKIVFFDLIMGTAKIGEDLEKYYTPKQIEAEYKEELDKFKKERKTYLIYN